MITEQQKQEIVNLYYQGLSFKKIADKTHYCSSDTVWNIVKKAGLPTNKVRLSDAEKSNICRLYLEGKTAKEILPLYKTVKSENTIISVVKQAGIQIRPSHKVTLVDHDFFATIDTEAKAYILGLLVADGCVIYPASRNGRERSPFWSLTLENTDAYILDIIKHEINYKGNIIHHGNKRTTSEIRVTSKRMVEDLAKYGVVPRKSFTVFFPKEIPSTLRHHFVRGFFDGDGCITNNICVFYSCGPILDELREVLSTDLNIKKRAITKRAPGKGANSFAFGKKSDVSAFYHYIYDDAKIFLFRKRLKFKIDK